VKPSICDQPLVASLAMTQEEDIDPADVFGERLGEVEQTQYLDPRFLSVGCEGIPNILDCKVTERRDGRVW
jgi:hypothetical protein